MLSRGYHYLLPLLAPAAEGRREGGVHLHDTHWFLLGGTYLLSMKSRSWPVRHSQRYLAYIRDSFLEREHVQMNDECAEE